MNNTESYEIEIKLLSDMQKWISQNQDIDTVSKDWIYNWIGKIKSNTKRMKKEYGKK